jgi:hypothetical protein
MSDIFHIHKGYFTHASRSHITLIKSIFSAVGMRSILVLVLGLVTYIRSVDNIKGGYEYPFASWSGKTIDFSAM